MSNKPIPSRQVLQTIYERLIRHFGPQHWWPGETAFEVAVGAILTQNTSWKNAAYAVANLKRFRLLDPFRLKSAPIQRLAGCIRPCGYYRQKAKYLKAFAEYLCHSHHGRMDRMAKIPIDLIRKDLLDLPGIGPETADSILLYALGKPIFVVDAYTRRVLARHSLIPWDADYHEIQSIFMDRLPHQSAIFNEYHALLVAVGKKFCRPHPHCSHCPLRRIGRLNLETVETAENRAQRQPSGHRS
jgi:endonuclease-3 related protein